MRVYVRLCVCMYACVYIYGLFAFSQFFLCITVLYLMQIIDYFKFKLKLVLLLFYSLYVADFSFHKYIPRSCIMLCFNPWPVHMFLA